MNRRVIALFIMMLTITSIFSAKIEHEFLPSQGLGEKLTVVLNLGPDATFYISGVEIGFSSNEINDINDEVEIINGKKFALTFEESNSHASVVDDIYVYWKIKNNHHINATLQIEGPLTNGSGEQLDWSAGVVDGSYKIGIDSYYTGSLAVLPQEVQRASGPVAGSRELEIVTKELNSENVVPGEYIGELKLNISII